MKLVKILVLFSVFPISANHLICLQNNSSTAHTGLPSVVAYLNTLRNNYISDISQVWLPQNQIPGYQPQFNLELVSMEQAPFASRYN